MKLQDLVRTKKKGVKREFELRKKLNRSKDDVRPDQVGGEDELADLDDEQPLDPDYLPHF